MESAVRRRRRRRRRCGRQPARRSRAAGRWWRGVLRRWPRRPPGVPAPASPATASSGGSVPCSISINSSGPTITLDLTKDGGGLQVVEAAGEAQPDLKKEAGKEVFRDTDLSSDSEDDDELKHLKRTIRSWV
ncbi:hypothetical protein ZWY2020_028972 [Hordeum vulgare]|nr:hypothetical protein ZWY2020_028972 [Hordeum vulgare]